MVEDARVAGPDDRAVVQRLAVDARAEARTKRGGNVLVDHDLAAIDDVDAWFDPAADDTMMLVVVATIDDVVVGYGRVHTDAVRETGPLAVVEELYVDPEARGVGLGEAMMDHLVAWARTNGCRAIDARALPGDRATKNFFETFGLVARQLLVHRSLVEDRDGDA